MCGEYFDEITVVDREFWDRLADSLHRTAGDLLEYQPLAIADRVLGVGNHTRAAGAAAAVPALHQLMREAAQQEEEFVAFRRRVVALGIDPALADQAYEEAILASQQSPRPFRIADAEARLRRLVGPADLPGPPFTHFTGDESQAYPVQEASPHQQIVEDAHRAYAAHLERRERDLRAAYGIPDEATTAEAIRIIRQHGRRRGESLHAPERAMDIPGPPDENGEPTVVHFTTSFSVPMLTPEEARAAAARYLAGRSGSWVRGAAPLCHRCRHHSVSHTDGVGCDICGVAACPGFDPGPAVPESARELAARDAFRLDGESRLDAIDRVLALPDVDDGYRYGSDQAAFDTRPDHCWRCCAVEAENDLGTCDPCREDLRS